MQDTASSSVSAPSHDPAYDPNARPGRTSRAGARLRARSDWLHAIAFTGAGRFHHAEPSARSVCRTVRQLVAELLQLSADRPPQRRDGRRPAAHVRQVAMYICHVALQLSFADIGQAFGRDRTTVSHACNVVEDRRDDRAFDDFVATLERITLSVFAISGAAEHE